MQNHGLRAALARLVKEDEAATLALRKVRRALRLNHASMCPPAIFSTELEMRDAISRCCAEWVENGKWPITEEPVIGWLFYHRISSARLFAQFLASWKMECPRLKEKDILLWLLIECWNSYLVYEWRASVSE